MNSFFVPFCTACRIAGVFLFWVLDIVSVSPGFVGQALYCGGLASISFDEKERENGVRWLPTYV